MQELEEDVVVEVDPQGAPLVVVDVVVEMLQQLTLMTLRKLRQHDMFHTEDAL